MTRFWNDFWFKSIDSRQYSALRILFGAWSGIYLITFLPYLESEFSLSGWLGDFQQLPMENAGSWSLFFIDMGPYSSKMSLILMCVGIIASGMLIIGWKSRSAAFTCWIIWVSLWNRNALIMDGDDALLKLMCFYLILSPCGNSWSIDALCNSKSRNVEIWPLRLIQAQIALLYFVSGWVKFYSQEWHEGTILQYVLIHPHYARWYISELVGYEIIPLLLAALSTLIMWWELLFPILLMQPKLRKYSLLFGIVFHLGLLLTMNLRCFPLIMLSLYPAFAPDKWFSRFEGKLGNWVKAKHNKITKFRFK